MPGSTPRGSILIGHGFEPSGIKWRFSPPPQKCLGEVDQDCKEILSTTLKQQILDEEGLHTLLCETEAIINSKPITKASSNTNDLVAFMPNHLLLLRCKLSLPPGLFDKQDLYAQRRWKQMQYMAKIFWK